MRQRKVVVYIYFSFLGFDYFEPLIRNVSPRYHLADVYDTTLLVVRISMLLCWKTIQHLSALLAYCMHEAAGCCWK